MRRRYPRCNGRQAEHFKEKMLKGADNEKVAQAKARLQEFEMRSNASGDEGECLEDVLSSRTLFLEMQQLFQRFPRGECFHPGCLLIGVVLPFGVDAQRALPQGASPIVYWIHLSGQTNPLSLTHTTSGTEIWDAWTIPVRKHAKVLDAPVHAKLCPTYPRTCA
eukprot:1161346-Pelagomonas_calceolata.AAC.12